MKLWIDDMRDAPDSSWTEVRKVQPAIKALALFLFDEISIDHDIENRPDDETFVPVVYYLAEKYWQVKHYPHYEVARPLRGPKITIHSDNPVGAKEMVAILKDHGIEAKWEPYTTDEAFRTKYGLA